MLLYSSNIVKFFGEARLWRLDYVKREKRAYGMSR